MKRLLAVTAVSAMALALTAHAQKKPDFSGTWLIDQAATSAAGGGAPSGAGAARGAGMGAAGIVIKHDGDTFTIQSGTTGGLTYNYKLDGVEREVTAGRVALKALSKWEGDKLVIEQTRAGADGTPLKTTTTYSLDKDGNLWTETTTPGGVRKIAYKKKPADAPKII